MWNRSFGFQILQWKNRFNLCFSSIQKVLQTVLFIVHSFERENKKRTGDNNTSFVRFCAGLYCMFLMNGLVCGG
ncbi:hypothetical protein HMPREF0860_2045 [Treponema socranskii subsp. socranskii VPI DR56BR1116 = ATCC 35536]|uniref:Uncharacterized protein n=1 Tax=Treponema socranskii subsp. socranskii VPI DR56BR1116 = ATCC 35536 TaxID=1125725 RepID=U1GQ86_TRESO|nr:hypothetical protein HMPREF1325_0489 [Treponema socranskii subsp. socranskii VPI DR56BR1116 = ATCC 35536]ERK03426.1 hypothetical protein HMPREF0860_2045 [Treponema socranskii subsp. socranskii VPI DR56BR1116 = ATCC 35536]